MTFSDLSTDPGENMRVLAAALAVVSQFRSHVSQELNETPPRWLGISPHRFLSLTSEQAAYLRVASSAPDRLPPPASFRTRG